MLFRSAINISWFDYHCLPTTGTMNRPPTTILAARNSIYCHYKEEFGDKSTDISSIAIRPRTQTAHEYTATAVPNTNTATKLCKVDVYLLFPSQNLHIVHHIVASHAMTYFIRSGVYLSLNFSVSPFLFCLWLLHLHSLPGWHFYIRHFMNVC